MEEFSSKAVETAEQEDLSRESNVATDTSKNNEILNDLPSPVAGDNSINKPTEHTENIENSDTMLLNEPTQDVIEEGLTSNTVETEMEKMHSGIAASIVEKESSVELLNENDKMDWTDDISDNVNESSNNVKEVTVVRSDDKELEKECEKINFHHIADLVNDNISVSLEPPNISAETSQKIDFTEENSPERTCEDKDKSKANSAIENDTANPSIEVNVDKHINQEHSKALSEESSIANDQVENVDSKSSTSIESKNDDGSSRIVNQNEKMDNVTGNLEYEVSEKTVTKESDKDTLDGQMNDSTTTLDQEKDKVNYNQRENTEFVQVNTENEKDGEDNEKEDETNNRTLMEHDPIASDSFEPINNEDREGADEELCIIPDTQREISQVNERISTY